jgi:hypothetical protein
MKRRQKLTRAVAETLADDASLEKAIWKNLRGLGMAADSPSLRSQSVTSNDGRAGVAGMHSRSQAVTLNRRTVNDG